MAPLAIVEGKVICFRCRSSQLSRCRCGPPGSEAWGRRRPTQLGLWLAAAALLGTAVGAALSLLHG